MREDRERMTRIPRVHLVATALTTQIPWALPGRLRSRVAGCYSRWMGSPTRLLPCWQRSVTCACQCTVLQACLPPFSTPACLQGKGRALIVDSCLLGR